MAPTVVPLEPFAGLSRFVVSEARGYIILPDPLLEGLGHPSMQHRINNEDQQLRLGYFY